MVYDMKWVVERLDNSSFAFFDSEREAMCYARFYWNSISEEEKERAIGICVYSSDSESEKNKLSKK